MIRISLILAFACFLPADEWATFKSADCSFEVDLPGEVTVLTDTLRSGAFTAVLYDYSANLDSTSFIAACSPLPPHSIGSSDLDDLVIETIGDSDLTSFDRLTVRGFPARRWTESLDFGSGPMVTHRLMVQTDKHQFHLATGMYTAARDVERFFGSFKLH